MKKTVGIWIDHKTATLVTLTDKSETVKRMASDVEKQLRRGGDRPLKGRSEHMTVPADDHRQRTLTMGLNRYYDTVAKKLCGAQAILIFGPGNAKNELKKRLERHKLDKLIIKFEIADKMTERQFTAKVRKLAEK